MVKKIFAYIVAMSISIFIGIASAREIVIDISRDVLREVNIARTQPQVYVQKLKKYRNLFRGRRILLGNNVYLLTREGVAAVDEAINFLKRQKPISPLKPSRGLTFAARDHARDQGYRGSVGHNGSDGSSPFDRMNRYGQWKITAGENISYGEYTGEGVIRQLIVDDGVPNRGHRKNIYNAAFKRVGIACGYHKVYRYMCVMDFAGDFQEK